MGALYPWIGGGSGVLSTTEKISNALSLLGGNKNKPEINNNCTKKVSGTSYNPLYYTDIKKVF